MVVDLPVPRSPMTMTPPILGSITFRMSASFISSWPTMAVKGKTGRAAPERAGEGPGQVPASTWMGASTMAA